ncbi:MAG: hypothetical protein C4293_14310, partial [Nitrospiraceae bacterium]
FLAARDRALAQAQEEIAQRKRAEAALHKLNEELEQRVVERTVELTKVNEALRSSREELRALTAQLLTVQEEERRRISCELHDDLNQKLAVLVMNVEAIERHLAPSREKSREQLRLLRNEVAELSDNVRRLAYQLHPSILDHLGPAIALQSQVEDFARREKIQATFTQRNLPESLPQDISTCLYRVAQEGLRNVAKHAQASRVIVRLLRCDHSLHLSIVDTGVGFDTKSNKNSPGLGFVSMQERVRLVQGKLSVRSSPGRGTHLFVRVPYRSMSHETHPRAFD